jgi:hypothetical protein
MSPRTQISQILAKMPPISLAETEQVKLMDRKDAKYILPLDVLVKVLGEVVGDYHVLEVDGTRVQSYQSTYFDTPGRQAYLEHHNGHLNRTKIRIRDYMESALSFLELKTKDNLRKTVKTRTPIDFLDRTMPSEEQLELQSKWKHGIQDLQAVLGVRFGRAMLANLDRDERVTIDLGLEFELLANGKTLSLGPLVVVEVKRPKQSTLTPMQKSLQQHHVKKSGISKYCVGMAMLEPSIKSHRFKPLLRQIESIVQSHTTLHETS